MEETRLMVAKVEEYEELRAIDFLLKRWKQDKENELVPRIREVEEMSERLESRWMYVMQEFDRFFKKEKLVPREAEFFYFVEDGHIYAAPKPRNIVEFIVRD